MLGVVGGDLVNDFSCIFRSHVDELTQCIVVEPSSCFFSETLVEYLEEEIVGLPMGWTLVK